ncbi:MAG TPA: adenylate/guanylate cyclase domain-containing protein [Anaerolineales bacterium]|nr:adenylate/guanylate cyclase domain-containing protein [Anaerolineales bacterium]
MRLLRRLRPTYPLRSTILAFLTVFFVTFITLLGAAPGLPSFELFELKAIDGAFNLRGPLQPTGAYNEKGKYETTIVIVAIDDESIRETQQQWPWPRAYMAKLVSAIAAGKPKSITTDIFWSEPGTDPGGDAGLAKAIADAGNVILANDINFVTGKEYTYSELRNPLPELKAAALHIGLANLGRDSDGYTRTLPLFLIHEADQQAYFSWSAYTVFEYLDVQPPDTIRPSALQIGSITVPLHSGYINVNYLGNPGVVFDQAPAYQVVNGEVYEQRGQDFFEGKIVLVGATTESLHDTYPVPFRGNIQPMPGVEINAHVIDTILSQRFINRWSIMAGALVTLIVGLIAYAISGIPLPFLSLALVIGTGILYIILWAVSFVQLRTEIYIVAPLVSLTLGYAVPSVERTISEQLEKRRVRGIFERFVSPEMVERMIDRGVEATRGQRTELTVLFSDIRGFTTMSEQMAPEEIVDMLNEYLGVMTDVIYKHGGTIDKYEGDLIMAFFNAPIPQPDHARRAVEAAIDMRLTLDKLKAKWAKEGDRPTHFDMGIGLNTGDVFVGLIGSEKRINYTCIGDSVNIASRVQDLTKDVKWPLLITEFTYAKVKDHFDCQFAEAHMVKGKTKPVQLYRVLGRKGAPDSERIRPLFA